MSEEGISVDNDRKMTYCVSLKMVNTVISLMRRLKMVKINCESFPASTLDS